MKKILVLSLFSVLSYSQTQIGGDIDGEAAGDNSGRSVSISGDGLTLAVGAPFNNNNGNNDAGHVRVYKKINGNWSQIGQDINGEQSGDHSGIEVSLSLDGSIVAIGAYDNFGSGYQSGHVRVYKNINESWSQIGQDINGEAANDNSGFSISISDDGTVVAIGAGGNDGNGSDSGHTRIYKNINGSWSQIGQDINGQAINDYSGGSVSLSGNGNIVALGALYNDDNGSDSGNVRVFENLNGTWTQIGSNINGEAVNDISGYRISLSKDGTTIAIAAPNNAAGGTGRGRIRIFKNINGNWSQVGQNINGIIDNESSGTDVTISRNGTIVAISSYGSNGFVKVFEFINGNWSQVGTTINGENGQDFSGYSISLSDLGNILAIGAFQNDGNGNDSGHVRVFSLPIILSSDTFVQNNFLIYPNPASENLTIELQNSLELQNVNFYNTLGKLVKTSKTTTVNVSELAKGNYFVEVITNQGKATKTIIIE